MDGDQLRNFDHFSNEYNIYGILAMDKSITKGILRGRSYGGVSLFIRKSLCWIANNFSIIACKEKYVIVKVDNLLLINVYLPGLRIQLIGLNLNLY